MAEEKIIKGGVRVAVSLQAERYPHSMYCTISSTSPAAKRSQSYTELPINLSRHCMSHVPPCWLEMTTELFCATMRLQAYFTIKKIPKKMKVWGSKSKTIKILLFATITLPAYMQNKETFRSRLCTSIKQYKLQWNP